MEGKIKRRKVIWSWEPDDGKDWVERNARWNKHGGECEGGGPGGVVERERVQIGDQWQ